MYQLPTHMSTLSINILDDMNGMRHIFTLNIEMQDDANDFVDEDDDSY